MDSDFSLTWIFISVSIFVLYREYQKIQRLYQEEQVNHQQLQRQYDEQTIHLTRNSHQTEELQLQVENLQQGLENAKKEISHQKGRAQSAHTLKGQLLEKWAPFVQTEEDLPSPRDWTFFGSPLDYIAWCWYKDKKKNQEQGKIIFIDVKSSKSTLTTKQRRIKELIDRKQVVFQEIKLA